MWFMVIKELNTLKQLVLAKHIVHTSSYSAKIWGKTLCHIAIVRSLCFQSCRQTNTTSSLRVVHLLTCKDIIKIYVSKCSKRLARENTNYARFRRLSFKDRSTSKKLHTHLLANVTSTGSSCALNIISLSKHT